MSTKYPAKRVSKKPQPVNRAMKRLKFMMDGEVHLYAGLLKHKLHSEPILNIHVHGHITAGLVNTLITMLHGNPGSNLVRVHINSVGGVAYEAFHLFASLKAHPANLRNGVTAYISGACMSAALVVAMGCKKRIARPDSVFLHHSAHGGSDRSVREVNEAIDNTLKVCADREGQAAFDTLKLRGNEHQPFAAFEAQALSIVHEVREFEPRQPSEEFLDQVDNAEYLENPEEYENKPKRLPAPKSTPTIEDRANAWADMVIEKGIPVNEFGCFMSSFPRQYYDALKGRMQLPNVPMITPWDAAEFKIAASRFKHDVKKKEGLNKNECS